MLSLLGQALNVFWNHQQQLQQAQHARRDYAAFLCNMAAEALSALTIAESADTTLTTPLASVAGAVGSIARRRNAETAAAVSAEARSERGSLALLEPNTYLSHAKEPVSQAFLSAALDYQPAKPAPSAASSAVSGASPLNLATAKRMAAEKTAAMVSGVDLLLHSAQPSYRPPRSVAMSADLKAVSGLFLFSLTVVQPWRLIVARRL
jgi:hypothetical protein